jgi:hypothetical protein
MHRPRPSVDETTSTLHASSPAEAQEQSVRGELRDGDPELARWDNEGGLVPERGVITA